MQKSVLYLVLSLLLISSISGCFEKNDSKIIEDDTINVVSMNDRITRINNVEFEFINIYPGSFKMGNDYWKFHENERHVRVVNITKTFQIGKFEVTQAQWEVVNGDNPSFHVFEDNPVEQISWYDCKFYIEKLNSLDTTHNYRFPTQAEWEYCCQAGSDSRYCFGDNPSMLSNYAWYRDNCNETYPVGKKTPNNWDIHDMHGNVREWCQDWHQRNYYEISPDSDPQGPEDGSYKTNRGGGYTDSDFFCSSANSNNQNPDFSSKTFGLRLVRELI